MIQHSLIADAGGSSTDWALIGPNGEVRYQKSRGLNLNSGNFGKWLDDLKTWRSKLPGNGSVALTLYAAGLTEDMTRQKVKEAIEKVGLPGLTSVDIQDDMMGACKAVYDGREIIVGILGTGSNACLFDGVSYKQFNPSLGYILGDDGGGVDLGKRLIREYFYGDLPPVIRRELEGPPYHLSRQRVIQKLYREDFPGGWLASFAGVYTKWHDHSILERMLLESFDTYYSTRITTIPDHAKKPIFLLGGIAREFSGLLFDLGKRRGGHFHIPDRETIRLLAEKEAAGHKKRPNDGS